MKRFSLFIAAAAFAFTSCGTGKKLQAANTQIQSLDSQVTSLKNQVSDNEKQISQLKIQNAQVIGDLETCRKTGEASAARLDQLNSALAEQARTLEIVRQKAAMALSVYQDSGIDVTYKNGLVYISLGEHLMFASGSATVNEMGKQALSVVADVLIEYPHLKSYIVGNTDTVKFVKGKMDNWSLSTERAIAIVKVLRDKYGIDPARLTAAGRGKYDPVADNSTPEGRAKNRRTDIIINPNLIKVWNLMEKSTVTNP
jgi:chemotaxis protein MotB